MNKGVLLVGLVVLDASALVLTNGPNANVTAPENPAVGWQFVADNGPYIACGRRLFCSVQHVSFVEPIYRGELYHIDLLIEPPASDVRFLVVDHDVPEFSPIYICPTNGVVLGPVWLVGGGVGTGDVVGGTNYFWGAEATRRLRWASSGSASLIFELGYYVWRSDQAGASSGDSGYGAFTSDGRYIGPIQFGANPMTVGQWQSGGGIASAYLDWLNGDIPPKPRAPGAVSVTAH